MTFITPAPVARCPRGVLIIGWLGRNMKAFSIGPFGPLISSVLPCSARPFTVV